MKSSELFGVVVPAITPVDRQDRVDEAAYRSHLRFLIASGINAIFVGGTAGEGPLLADAEWERMVTIAFDECSGHVAVLGGTMDTSTERVLRRIRLLRQIGYQHFVATPTFYVKLTQPEEHLRLFGACREAAGEMNMIAYNIPSCTSSTVPVEVLGDMVRRGWIRYCKDSSDDMAYFGRLAAELMPQGLRVLMGSELNAAQALSMGAAGIVPVCANYQPETFLRAFRAKSEPAELAVCQAQISLLVRELIGRNRSWLGGVKSAVATRGYSTGRPVSPIEPLSTEEERQLQAFCSTQAAPAS